MTRPSMKAGTVMRMLRLGLFMTRSEYASRNAVLARTTGDWATPGEGSILAVLTGFEKYGNSKNFPAGKFVLARLEQCAIECVAFVTSSSELL